MKQSSEIDLQASADLSRTKEALETLAVKRYTSTFAYYSPTDRKAVLVQH